MPSNAFKKSTKSKTKVRFPKLVRKLFFIEWICISFGFHAVKGQRVGLETGATSQVTSFWDLQCARGDKLSLEVGF